MRPRFAECSLASPSSSLLVPLSHICVRQQSVSCPALQRFGTDLPVPVCSTPVFLGCESSRALVFVLALSLICYFYFIILGLEVRCQGAELHHPCRAKRWLICSTSWHSHRSRQKLPRQLSRQPLQQQARWRRRLQPVWANCRASEPLTAAHIQMPFAYR